MMSRHDALAAGRAWVEAHADQLERAAIVGSVLRDHPTCKDVDVLAVPKAGVKPVALPPVNLFLTTHEGWEASVLQYAPGMATIGIRAKAKAKGYRLNQYGLYRGEMLVASGADEICRLAGVPLPVPVRRSLAGELVLIPLRKAVSHGSAVSLER